MASASWTPERVAEVMMWRGKGLSAAKIAERFGCSRNAIIGVIGREVKRTGATPALKAGRRASPPAPIATIAPSRSRPAAPAARIPVSSLPLVASESFRGASGVPLTELAAGACRWPYDGIEGGPTTYCGCPTEKTYCARHAGLAYAPAAPRDAASRRR